MTSVATFRCQSLEILASINVIVGELLSERNDHKLFAIELFVRFRTTKVPQSRFISANVFVIISFFVTVKSSSNILSVSAKITRYASTLRQSHLDLKPGYQSTFQGRVKTKEVFQGILHHLSIF